MAAAVNIAENIAKLVKRTLCKQSAIACVWKESYRGYSTKELKRFYKNVSISKAQGGFEINLDKHKLKTPMGSVFRVPSEALALGVATEWDSQQSVVRKSTMHLTQLSNTAIDNPTMRTKETVIDSMIEYLATDTICYRIDELPELAELQEREWDPLLFWFQQRFGVQLSATTGLGMPSVPHSTKQTFRQYLNSFNSWSLVGFQEAVESTKSVIISTALINQELTVERAVQLTRLEMEFQIGRWGNVDWHHDVDKMEIRSRLAAAAIFVYLNSNESKTLDKNAVQDIV